MYLFMPLESKNKSRNLEVQRILGGKDTSGLSRLLGSFLPLFFSCGCFNFCVSNI